MRPQTPEQQIQRAINQVWGQCQGLLQQALKAKEPQLREALQLGHELTINLQLEILPKETVKTS